MLSKLSKYVMGLLHQKPMNPYEITKLSDMDVVQNWFPMMPASIYTTIKNLEKKGYIRGESLQEGNYPAKTRYSLTDDGVKELIGNLSNGLASYEAEASDFGIAIFHICSLPKEVALQSTKERLDKLRELLAQTQNTFDICIKKIPFNMKMMLIYKLNRLQMEIHTTEELFLEIERDVRWNYSFSDLLKKGKC